jgi:hypothetical protein
MLIGAGLFSGDLASAHMVDHELQQLQFGICDADNKSPVLAGVQSGKRYGAFAVDDSSDVGGDFRWQ